MLMSLVVTGAEESRVLLIDGFSKRPAWQFQLLAELLEGCDVPGGLLSPSGCLFGSHAAARMKVELSVVHHLGKNATRGKRCNKFMVIVLSSVGANGMNNARRSRLGTFFKRDSPLSSFSSPLWAG